MSTLKSIKRADYEWAVEFSRFFLRMIRLWPEDVHDTKRFRENLFVNIIVLLCTWFTIIPSVLFVFMEEAFATALNNFLYPVVLFTTTWKAFIFNRNRDAFLPILSMMEEDWEKPRTNEETNVMYGYANIIRKVTVCSFLVVAVPVLFEECLPILGIQFRYTTNNLDVFPLPTYYVYDVYRSPYFELIYATQVILLWFLVLSYCSIDMMFGMVVFHICGQVTNFRLRIKREKKFENFKRILAAIVTDHVRLSRAVDQIANVFKLILLVQMAMFGIVVCVYSTGIMSMVVKKDAISLTRIYYLIPVVASNSIQMLFYFINGQVLADQSEAIYHAVYECEWLNLKSNEVRSLILVMVRAKQPFLITMVKLFPLTMMTFGNVIKISFSYVSFLIARF